MAESRYQMGVGYCRGGRRGSGAKTGGARLRSCRLSWRITRWWVMRANKVSSGYHKYIDMIARGNACNIVNINLAVEFEIARRTTNFMMHLCVLLTMFIGSQDLIEHVEKLMCVAKTKSSGRGSICKPNNSAPTGGSMVCL